MKIEEKELFNVLVPTEKKYLVSKEELVAKQDAESKEQEYTLNYSTEIYLPKTITLDYCLERYEEIGEVLWTK